MNLVNNDGLYYVKSKQVEQIYQDLSTELMFNMIARLAERGNADLERNPYIWQLEKLNDMHLLTEESVKMISEKAGVAEEIFRDVIENEGYRIYKDSHEQLTTALKSNALPDPQVQASLNALVNQTMFEVDNLLNITLPKSIRRSFEQAVLGSVAGVVTGTKTAEKALSEAVQKAHKKGFYSFTDKAGRERSVEPHLRTIIKTTTRRTARELREKSAEDLGVDTFYYSIKSSARAYCAPLQHQIVSKGKGGTFDGVKVYALSDYGYGKPEGCQGINCDHYMTPFVLGMNYKPDLPDHLKNIDEKKAIENAKAEAKQRAFEREIRKSKELIEIAKIVNDKELEQKHKLRLKTLRSGLKQHIEKHPFLYRDTSRERGSKKHLTKTNKSAKIKENKNGRQLQVLRLEAKNIGKKIDITDEAISKVPLVKIPGFNEQDSKNLQSHHKELLSIAKSKNNSNEVSGVYNLTSFSGVKYSYGNRKNVDFNSDVKVLLNASPQSSLVVIHNHPGQSNFSLTDIKFFFTTPSVKTLTVVTNKGGVKYISKNTDYNIGNSMIILEKYREGIEKAKTDKELNRLVEKYLKDVIINDKGIDVKIR